jgi:hypothetical protein
MKPTHVLVLAAAVAIAAVAGTYAAMRTTHLSVASAQPARVSAVAIVRQNRALDRTQAALLAELKRKPPALPPVPAPAPVSAPAVRTAAPVPAAAAPVVYVRPKPIVHVIHRHGEGEHEHDSGDSAAGGNFDD